MKLILVFESKRLRSIQQKHALLRTVCHEYKERYEAALRRAVNAEDIQTSTVESSLRKQAQADAEIARLKQEVEQLKSADKGQTFYGPKDNEHNPDNLTPKQYGMGQCYRLLDKDEVSHWYNTPSSDIERYVTLDEAPEWDAPCCGNCESFTYRTRLTREQLRAARGLK